MSVPCCPDFVLWPKTKKNGESKSTLRDCCKPVAVFTDGFAYHRDRADDDTLKRMALLRSRRFRVWSVNWEDVQAVFDQKHPLSSLWPMQEDRRRSFLAAFMRGMDAEREDWLTEAELSSPMLLLHAYLGGGRDVENVGGLFAAHAKATVMACKALLPQGTAAWQRDAAKICAACNADLPNAQLACRYDDGGYMQALISVEKREDGLEPAILLRLDDAIEATDFESSWKRFWRLTNLCQFAPLFCMVSERGLKDGVYAALPAAEEPEASEISSGWEEIFDYLLPEELELAHLMAQTGLRAPDDAGVEIAFSGGGIAAATLVWRASRVAWFFMPDEEASRRFAAEGWNVFVGDNFPSDLDCERSGQ